MDKTICYNLCDQMENYETISEQAAGKRIYVGSYFCYPYVNHLPLERIDEVLEECRRTECRCTLVLPIVTEKYFPSMKQRVREILDCQSKWIDEICVNDYGTLDYIAKEYDLPIHLGRLFFKDYRDPRYSEYMELTCRPKLFNPHFRKILEEYQICGLEFDPVVSAIDFRDAFPGMIYSVHSPYCYLTTGQICEYGSVQKHMDHKFRPNEPCTAECSQFAAKYHITEEMDWYRLGRAIYFRNESCQLLGITKIREIVTEMPWICSYTEPKTKAGIEGEWYEHISAVE